MKKVLIVIGCLGIGGGEKSLINLLNLFDYEKYNVDLLVFNDTGLLVKQIPDNVNIVKKDNSLRCLYNKPAIGEILKKDVLKTVFLRCLCTFISRKKEKNINRAKQYRWEHFYKSLIKPLPDKYETVFAYMNDDSMYYVSDLVESPNKIAWIHNDYYAMGYNENIDRQHFAKFNKVVTISDECLRILKEIFPEYSDKFGIVQNLTDSKVVWNQSEEYFPKEYEGLGSTTKLLSVGRLSNQKGYDLAISAAEIMKNANFKFIWFIIGEGELRKEMQSMISDRNLDEHVILCGIRENPYPYIRNCDIFVQPSRFEGKSVVLDEARILCKPIVATKYTTVYDQLTDGTNGYLVDMDAKSLATGIMWIEEHQELKAKLIQNLKEVKQENIEHITDYYNLVI